MELSRILIREMNDYQIIELREIDGDRTFPIVIGLPEAQAIERRLRGIEIKRPQTHELLMSIVEAFGGELKAIEINDLSDHTFYARLQIRKADGTMLSIDSRPSDAIALGIAKGAPIFVDERVLEEAQSGC
jgi:hypothetical protein